MNLQAVHVSIVARIYEPDVLRLFLAANDMLAACREALTIRNLSYQVDANEKIDILERKRLQQELCDIDARIKAAIAKAEGSK